MQPSLFPVCFDPARLLAKLPTSRLLVTYPHVPIWITSGLPSIRELSRGGSNRSAAEYGPVCGQPSYHSCQIGWKMYERLSSA